MSVALISHPVFALHKTGRQHPESPQRVLVIQKALENFAFKTPVKFYEAPLATSEQLMNVHDESYVKWIISVAPKHESIGIDPDTIMSPHTLEAAFRAAGAVVMAVDLVMQDKAQVAFCNVRPPGHHAEHEKAMGFCIFNNVAVGVAYALSAYDLKRIAIIDFDVHHGNGTQDIFQHNKHVLYCSSFEHPFYPGYDDERDNDHIVGVPLPANTTGEEFRQQVKEKWFAKIAAFAPELIFISAGFDAHADDPLADLKLQKADYEWVTTEIAKLANTYCKGRMISVLEGGYNLDVLAECVPAHINAMLV